MNHKQGSLLTVTDMFCGAGGSSQGVLAAGAELMHAINHWDLATRTYSRNHPNAKVWLTDINHLPPKRVGGSRILIASPECQGHTNAKGVNRQDRYQLNLLEQRDQPPDPSAERSRATMFNIPEWAEAHHYEAIIIENVVEANDWLMYPAWLHAMTLLGYDYKQLYLNSMFFPPTPQSRDRLYVVFWKKRNKAPDLEFTFDAYCPHCERSCTAEQYWKKQPGRGKYRAQYYYRCTTCKTPVIPPYYPAASAIDWDLPCPTIGSRIKRPIVTKTRERIRTGLAKYPCDFLVDAVHTPRDASGASMSYPITHAHRTLIGQQTTGLVIQTSHSVDHNYPLTYPLPTLTTRQDFALLTTYYGTSNMTDPATTPAPTVTTVPHAALLKPHPFIYGYYTRDRDQAATSSIYEPHPTLSTQKRHALIIPSDITDEQIDACGYRMIKPKEHKTIMGFATDFEVEGNGDQQVAQLGNAVTPPVMTAIFARVAATFN